MGTVARDRYSREREIFLWPLEGAGIIYPANQLRLMHNMFHPLADELPGFREDINRLSAIDPRFRELMTQYRKVDHQIRLADENIEPKCDETVEMFKRQRLVLMDEMVHLIRTKPARAMA